MVKNLSNPLISRKVAKIISDDAEKLGFTIDETRIRLYLYDNQINSLFLAIDELKSAKTIPLEYNISNECLDELKKNEFIEMDATLDINVDVGPKDYKRPRDHEMKSQIDSLISKVFKLKSVDVREFDRYLQRYDVNFGKPMDKLIAEMNGNNIELSEIQAFSIVFSADHLGLRESSKEKAYHYIYGRFDDIKDYLNSIGIEYTWPDIRGSGFIDIGKKYSTSVEIVEFAHILRTSSGIDTYSDEIIQEFFVDLLDGTLLAQMSKTKNIWKWSIDESDNPFDYIIPQLNYGVDNKLKELLIQTSITYIILSTLSKAEVSFKEIIDSVLDLSRAERIKLLSTNLEHGLTKKSIELQFGTMVTFHFENLKSDPGESTVFLDACVRYFSKFQSITPLKNLLNHSIKAGLKNSFGGIRKYLKLLSEDEFNRHISSRINNACKDVFCKYDELSDIASCDDNTIDAFLHVNKDLHHEYFKKLMNKLFAEISQFVKDLEPEEKEKTDGKGGLKERTQDFISTIKHHATNNSMVKDIVSAENNVGIFIKEFEYLVQVSSYASYQIASKEGSKGEELFRDIIQYYREKYLELSKVMVNDTQTLVQYNKDLLEEYLLRELTQVTVIMSLSSNTRTEAFNSWTQIKSVPAKNAIFLNEFVIKNLLFWQRLPRDLINTLRTELSIDKSVIRDILIATRRINMIEPYSLLVLGYKADINNFADAKEYIFNIFGVTDEKEFRLNARSGEAEIIQEVTYLWNNLIDKSDDKQVRLNKYVFPPIELALILPKGFIHEYKDRKWFDQIYFGKLAMSNDQSGYKPILYQFSLEYSNKYDQPLPENILMTFYYPETKSITNLSGLVIIGGQANIYESYRITKLLTPQLEALLLEKYPISNDKQISMIEETLSLVSTPVNIKSPYDIMEQTVRSKGSDLTTFYPIIDQEEMTELSLPNDFRVDAVFVISIEDNFFSTEKIGDGLQDLTLFVNDGKQIYKQITADLVYPLILKWQPVYNDILSKLKKRENKILPNDFKGHLKPNIVAFEQSDGSNTVLISKVTTIKDKNYYNVALARSGYGNDGKPISLIQSALSREKFGSETWRKQIDTYNLELKNVKTSSSDHISLNLKNVIDKLSLLTKEREFDLGLVLSLK